MLLCSYNSRYPFQQWNKKGQDVPENQSTFPTKETAPTGYANLNHVLGQTWENPGEHCRGVSVTYVAL